MYALTLLPVNDGVKPVTGLPTSQYQTQEVAFKMMILENRYNLCYVINCYLYLFAVTVTLRG